MRSWFALLVPVLAAGGTAFQDPIPASTTRAAQPGGAEQELSPTERIDDIDGGPVLSLPVTDLGDEIPVFRIPGRGGEETDGVEGGELGNPYFIGYIAGPYFPPADERIDPLLIDAERIAASHGRPGREVFATVMFEKRLTEERVAELESMGVRFLGFQPHYAARCALPPESIERVSMHPAVRWVGFPRTWQKVQPRLERSLVAARQGDVFDLWIFVQDDDRCAASTARPMGSIYESDQGHVSPVTNPEALPLLWQSNGWQQRALEERGIGIDWYEPTLNAFRAKVPLHAFESLPSLDFVSFLELVTPVEPLHDQSSPMIHADVMRAIWGGNSGQNAVAALIDSGVLSSHSGLDHAFMAGWDFLGLSPFTDECNHGTHVTGTILGEPGPGPNAAHRGIAPGLASTRSSRFRSVKAVYQPPGERCSLLGAAFSLVLGTLRTPYIDLQGNISPAPHVINNSWGQPHDQAAGNIWFGTEASSIAFDADVYTFRQIHVFAAGNDGSGSGTIGSPAVAKNVFTVGSVNDSVTLDGLSDFSSRGPCGDDRWKPNVVAPGSAITSTTPNGGYSVFEGTSMAAPHVTGLVAQVVDHYASLAYDPPRVHAFLMATAWQRNNAVISSETDSHLDRFGAGRVDAYRPHNDTSDWDRTTWAFDAGLTSFRVASFNVPQGATRLVVCMNYIEPPALPGASQALIHDLDLTLDAPPITDPMSGTSGEYTLQRSSIDNTEFRVIDDPVAGQWLWKVYPRSMNAFTPLPRVGVTVLVVLGDREPDLAATLTATPAWVQPNEDVDVTTTVSTSDYLASAVGVTLSASSSFTLRAAGTTLLDGLTSNLLQNEEGGRSMRFGSIREGTPRRGDWTMRFGTEGTKTITVNATSESANPATRQTTVIVDGTPPPAPVSLSSTTHTPNAWNNSRTITFQWSEPVDNLSGIDGYADATGSTSIVNVGTRLEFGPTTTRTITLSGDTSRTYYGLRAFDRAGNVGTVASVGPFRVDTAVPGLPTNLRSTSHTPGRWSNDPSVDLTWQAATDSLSGLDGYGEANGTSTPVVVGPRKDLEENVTTRTLTFASSAAGHYYALRTVDNAGNWSPGTSEIGPFLIDTVAPSAISNLSSSTHVPGTTWSRVTSFQASWSAATDALSGIGGYVVVFDTSPTTTPAGAATTATTMVTRTLASSAQGWYLHVRPVDAAGNYGPVSHLGPFLIDDQAPNPPGNLRSPTHPTNQWTANDQLFVEWNTVVDPHSGLQSWRFAVDGSPTTVLTPSGNLSAGRTSYLSTVPSSANPQYVHMIAIDQAQNFSTTAHLGPILIDVEPPTNVSLLIEQGGTSIGTNTTTLTIAAQDAHSGVFEMRFRNDAGNWSPWEPFATTKSWDLFAFSGSTETGTRRVDLEVRDRAGNTVSAFDRVFYFRPFRWLEPGCAGSLGIPDFDSPDVAAFVGAPSFDLTLSNTAAPVGGLYMGLSNQIWSGMPLPLDLQIVGAPGCYVHVSLELSVYTGPTLPTITIPMVNDPSVIGLVFYFQWLLFSDPSGVPVVTTRGLEAEINRS